MGFSGRIGNSSAGVNADTWKHRVSVRAEKIQVDDEVRKIYMTEREVLIGCTTVTREAIEKLAKWFEEHFPKGGKPGVTLQ